MRAVSLAFYTDADEIVVAHVVPNSVGLEVTDADAVMCAAVLRTLSALGVGLRKPKDPRLGVDMSGVVEAVGKNVTQFKPGDAVFGGRNGAFAEYVCVGVTTSTWT